MTLCFLVVVVVVGVSGAASAQTSRFIGFDPVSKIAFERILVQKSKGPWNEIVLTIRFTNLRGKPAANKRVRLRWDQAFDGSDQLFPLRDRAGRVVQQSRTDNNGVVTFRWIQRRERVEQNVGQLNYFIKRRRVVSTKDVEELVLF